MFLTGGMRSWNPFRRAGRAEARFPAAGRPSFAALAAAALLLALAAPARAPAEEALTLVVEGDRIRAGDLARVIGVWTDAPPGQVLGYAPLPGIRRRVSRPQLLRWAREAGLKAAPEEMPPAVVVSRRMRRLETGELKDLLSEALARSFQLPPERIEVELTGGEEPLVPDGSLSFDLGSRVSRFNEPARLYLRWRDGGGRTGNLRVSAVVRVRGSFAEARADLPARTRLAAGDFVFREGPLPGDPEEYLLTPQEVHGKQLRYSLRQGDLLRGSQLEQLQVVRRGDLIELRLRTGAVLLRVGGRAEEPGGVGDEIRIKNLESGQQVRARIIDSQKAEVLWTFE